MVTEGDDAAIDRYMDAYDRVFEKSWKPWEAHPAFDRALAKAARDKGRLRLGLLFVDDEAVAGQLWMVCDETAFAVRKAYDGAYRKYSPGVAMSAEMMMYVIDHDHVREVDYLLGDDDYKRLWMPEKRERRSVLAFNTSRLRGRLLSGAIMKVAPVMRGNRVLGVVRKGVLKMLRAK
jgi:CelD/BcsL family acetyltransferase involved in cellulose biosynthesis